MAKLTLHFTTMQPWGPGTVREAQFPWAKWVNPSGPDLWPGQRTIGRLLYGNMDGLWREGRAGGEEWYRQARPRMDVCRWVYVWELFNEPVCKDDDPAAYLGNRLRLAEATVRAAELAHRDGFRVATGSFAMGTPRLAAYDKGQSDLPELRPVFEAGDYWSLHQYGYESMENLAPYYALRHRQLLAELRSMGVGDKPILITETGIEPGGWRKHASWAGFQRQLEWYSGELDKDALVQCAALFKSGGWGFEGFEIGLAEAGWLSAYVRSHPSPVVTPTPTPTPPPPVVTPVPGGLAVIKRRFTPAEFAAYVQGLTIIEPFDKVCVHHTWKPTVARWLEFGGTYWMDALLRFYRSKIPPWTRFPHVFAAPDGIWVLGDLALDGAGVANGNARVRHVETVGDYTAALPSGATLDNAIAATATLLRKCGKGIEATWMHRQLQADETCPGAAFAAKWSWFRGLVAAALQPPPPPQHPLLAPVIDARWKGEEAARALEGLEYERAHALLLDQIQVLYGVENTLRAT